MKKRRKNYLPTLILMVVLWVVLGVLITQVEPGLVKDVMVPGLYLPLFLVLFPASFLTLAVVLADSKKGFLVALGLNVFLVLRVYQVGNLLNGLLIIGIVVALVKYFES